MPHAISPTQSSKKTRHHHRRYSWPPSIQLIDISNIHVPLPEIDEDPFAHFLAKVPDDDDDDDHVVYTAGILPTEQTTEPPTHAEKAFKFRTSILRRWKKFFDRYRAKLHSKRSMEVARQMKAIQMAAQKSPTIPHRTSSMQHHSNTDPSKKESSKPLRPDPSPIQAQLYRAAKGKSRRHLSPSQRRSWHAPSPWLYPISETLDEDEDDDV